MTAFLTSGEEETGNFTDVLVVICVVESRGLECGGLRNGVSKKGEVLVGKGFTFAKMTKAIKIAN